MTRLGQTICLVLAMACLVAESASPAGEEGVTIERVMPSQAADRARIAMTIYRHEFENRRDPDTGILLSESADLDNDDWPDFWEPIRAVGYPEYLINTIAIVPDTSGQVPGAYRDAANRILHIGYDGTRVGIRTRTPVPIDPGLSYEFSIRTRDSGLRGAKLRAGVDWMRVDSAAVEVLRSDDIPDLLTGQVDWAVRPAHMLINNPPANANAARFFVIVERLPGSVDGTYNGQLWIDDISLKSHPKIVVDAPSVTPGSNSELTITVRYTGLIDNVPDPANHGYFRGKRYTRRVEITDVFNRPVQMQITTDNQVDADDAGTATETITFPADRFGVYYFNIRLYDNEQRLATDVVRAVAVMRQTENPDRIPVRPGKPLFGIRTGVVPDTILSTTGKLGDIVQRSGARHAKLIPWRENYREPRQNDSYYESLVNEIRVLRSTGISVTGVVSPPKLPGQDEIAEAVTENPKELNRLLDEAGRRLGLFMDSWQWGNDDDGSLYGLAASEELTAARATLADYASGLPMANNLVLPGHMNAAFPARTAIVEGYLPADIPAIRLWPAAGQAFPWLFEPYIPDGGRIYPPARLTALASAPPADQVEEQVRAQRRSAVWLSLQPTAAHPYEANVAAEKTQLEQFLVRAVYAAILAPETVFVGELFDPEHGLLRRDGMGTATLETMARPIYMATGTLSRHLEGADYLGDLGLLPPFEAHVFRRPGTDSAVIAIWHNDSIEERSLSHAEIAAGPPLRLEDWAGNSTPLPKSIPVRRVPSFITGMSANLLLTRMSVRIAPNPPLFAVARQQSQTLEINNHMPQQAPVLFRLRYAAKLPDGAMENNWAVRPIEQRINLQSGAQASASGRINYSVTPDPNSPIQTATPERADKSGLKVAQVLMGVNTSPPADMTLYLPFRLQSELDVDIEALERVDSPQFVTLQLKVRWFPSAAARRRGGIRLLPFYVKRGQMRETAAFPMIVKASPAAGGSDPNLMFESVELRIPRHPRAQTWVGFDEDGGSGFYLADVTGFLEPP